MKHRGLHIALIITAAACTFASQVKLPALDPFSEALAGLGLTLGVWADKGAAFGLGRKEAPPEPGP